MNGRIVHIEIPADDTERAREFWGSLFGWEFQPFPGAEYYLFRIDEQSGGAISGTDTGQRGTRTYFDVEDVNAATARVRELGGDAGEPMPVPSQGWFVTCTDPHGNEFGLWQTDPEAPTPEM